VRGQGCSWLPERPAVLASAAPAHFIPPVADSDQTTPEPEDADHDDMMHPIREAMLNLLAGMCWSGHRGATPGN